MPSLEIKPEMVKCLPRVHDWEQAVRLSSQPLIDHGYINPGYVDDMIQTVHELGPYIVIAPMVAMPHARSQEAKRIGLAVLKLQEPVSFGENADATLIVPISVVDSESHLAMIQTLALVLSDEEIMNRLLVSNDPAEIIRLMSTEKTLDDQG